MSERFPRDYRGRYLTDISVRDDDTHAVVELCECRECGALTSDPDLHDAWHDGTAPRKGGD